jgi:hypothetical protein
MSDKKLRTGWEDGKIPDDFSIPSCGIADMDRAMFNLFDKDIDIQVSVAGTMKKVPVVFASGERFAVSQRNKPIRDKNNALILPIIAIHRKKIDHDALVGGYGSGISSRERGDLVIKRRISKKDANYQNIINQQKIKNQDNVSNTGNFTLSDIAPGNQAAQGTTTTRRNKNNLSKTAGYPSLKPDLNGDHIYEVITIPYPKFVKIAYSITIWTQYVTHVNKIIETLFANFPSIGHNYQVTTDAGYKFVAYMQTPLSFDDNFTDYATDERLVKLTFDMDLPGYFVAPQDVPGKGSPFRSFESAPNVVFEMKEITADLIEKRGPDIRSGDVNKFTLNNLEELDKRGNKVLNRDTIDLDVIEYVINPFTGVEEKKLSKVLSKNSRTGETVASIRTIKELENINNE